MEDEVAGCDHGPVSRRRYSRIGIAVERIGIDRAIISDFGTNLDLRREPMLPGQCDVSIVGYDSVRWPWGSMKNSVGM
jgi:hypothetical protein